MVGPSVTDRIAFAMKQLEHGKHAMITGEVAQSPPGMVLLETSIGGNRIIDMLQGEQLPRTC